MYLRAGALFLIVAISASPPARADDRILLAETTYFHFYSDLDFNHHNYLYGLAQTESGPNAAGQACLKTLPDDILGKWEATREFYNSGMGERHHRMDPIMRWLRFYYSGLEPNIDEPVGLAPVLAKLEGSRPAYVACFWQSHHALNRAWVEEQTAFLERFGEPMANGLAEVYETEWPRAVVVDLMHYSDNRGANTMSGPRMKAPHMTMTTDPNHHLSGIAAFEILFHETSHFVFGPRFGFVAKLINTASEQQDTRPPRRLWHAVSFYTSGHVLSTIVKADDFQPYWRKSGLSKRAWTEYWTPIESHWGPAIDGETEPQAAISAVIRDIVAARD